MPAPRVFVSSTCYDLKYIRENLRFFVRSLGFEPVLSEDGAVFYDPKLHVADACVAEVPSCQIFVLIIGGRYGSQYKGKSVTNSEYDAAVTAKLPIFALVEREVLEQSRVYAANRVGMSSGTQKIVFPAVDSTYVFDFIESVQANTINNALVPFADFEEMQSYLKKQWASMFHQFLTNTSEAKRVGDILVAISQSTDKIDFVTRQLLSATGDPIAKLKVEFYDYLIQNQLSHDLVCWKIQPSPQQFLKHESLDSLCGGQIEEDDDEDDYTLTYGGPPYRSSTSRTQSNRNAFKTIREELLRRLKIAGISVDAFLKDS